MQDRVPLYPGRVQLTPVSGNIYDMSMADQPQVQGTPLNKATLLKDATAALYGLTSAAVPDDAFAWLGKYAEYCWRRRAVNIVYQDISGTGNITVNPSGSSQLIRFSNSVNIHQGGEVSLVNPDSHQISYGDVGRTYIIERKPCYITNLYGDPSAVFYIPENANSAHNDSSATIFNNTNFTVLSVSATVKAKRVSGSLGEWELVFSTNRTAYPDSGIQDGYEYEYIGVPFEKLPTAPQIETGSYVGTGTYGASNPNSLTFSFTPKIILIPYFWGNNYGNYFVTYRQFTSAYWTVDMEGAPLDYTSNFGFAGSGAPMGKKSEDGKTIYWYNTSAADRQLNNSNTEYYYIAIG